MHGHSITELQQTCQFESKIIYVQFKILKTELPSLVILQKKRGPKIFFF